MKELDPLVFIAVFQEMLGVLFWPLIAFIVLGALALAVVLIRERGLDSSRLVWAELVGFFGGFVAIGLMLWVTASRPEDLLGGPIDWLLTVAIWAAGAVGTTIAAYVVLSMPVLRLRGPETGQTLPAARAAEGAEASHTLKATQ